MFQPPPSKRLLGIGLAIVAVCTIAIAANWGVFPRLGLFGPNEAAAASASAVLPMAPDAVATVGTGGTYLTLKAAFDDINSGSGGLTGAIQLDIVGNSTETATATLAASGTGGANYSSILIRPTGGASRTISGAITAGSPLIDLSGADRVTIDGLNTGGNSLTISNTTVSATAGTSTIRFIGGATANTITNTTVLGSSTVPAATAGGTIFFSTDTVAGTGNDGNVVSNSSIGPAGVNLPTKAMYFAGSISTAAANNSGIQVDNNNIYDYFGADVTSSGAYVGVGTADCTFSNNRFYQTAQRTQTTGAQHSAIWIANPSGNGFKVLGNTIGFASSAGTGIYQFVAVAGSAFVPMHFDVGTSAATSIQGNTVAGITMTGAGAGTGSSAPFRAIFVGGGSTAIGDGIANTIGSQTANDSIVYSSSAVTDSDVIAIANFGTSDWTTNNNLIGGITASNSAAGAARIFGIWAGMPSTAVWTVRNNTIGGTTAGSLASTSTAVTSTVQGLLTSNPSGTISHNVVRNLVSAGGTGTGNNASVAGIVVNAGSANHTVAGNTISGLNNSAAAGAGVLTGIQFTSASGSNLIERNLVSGLTSATNDAAAEINGIRAEGGTATYANNMVIVGAGVSNALGGGVSGIREVAGTNTLLHNSILVGGNPTAGSGASYALNSTATGNTRVFRNNIFFNARTNSGAATGKNYAVRVGGTAANPAGLTINNNVYFANGTGGVFGFFNAADVATLAAWKTAVGQDANSISSNPLFISATDLHLASGSPAIDVGATGLGVSDDFDSKSRPGGNALVDIGADEFDGVAAPANDLQATAFIEPTSGALRFAGTAFVPQASFTNNGTAAQTNVTVRYRICPDVNCVTSVYNQTVVIPSIASQATLTFAFPAANVASVGTYTIRAKAELAGDTVSANDEINGTLIVEGPLSGAITIGTGGTYTSLTQAINKLATYGVAGPVTLTLTDANYSAGETFPLSIGPIAGASSTNTITIKPGSGVSPTISGSSPSCVISLAGADYVTVDGSNNGTSSRDLTVTNTNVGTSSAVLCLQSAAGPNGATNNTLKNINVVGNGNTQTLFGIFSGAAGTPSIASLGSGNNANTFRNNNISKVQYGIYSQGASGAAKNTGNVIAQNLINTPAPNNVPKGGILLGFENNVQVTQNRLDSITHAGSPDVFGIALGLTNISTTTFAGNDVTNAAVTGNFLGNVSNTGTFSAAGITVASTTSGTNLIANNSLYGVASNGTSGDFGAAILLGGGAGSTTQVYYNSVSMTGTLAGGNYPNYCLAIGGTDPSVDVRNNAFYNTLVNGTGVSFAIGTASSTFANLTSNYNDLFVTPGGGTFKTGKTGSLSQGAGTEHTLLADWSTATAKDSTNSIAADPQFKSLTDLQPQTVSAVIGAGTPIAGVVTDIAGTTRSASAPSIGAYETGIDTLGPTITYTALINTASTSNRTLSISVSDLSGVPQTGTGLPRIYFRKGGTGPYSATTQCSFASGNNYNCLIDYSQLAGGGVAIGDVIEYFVAAQDTLGNVRVFPSTGSGGFTASPPAASVPPTNPSSYVILQGLNGVIKVGTSELYKSLTNNSATGLFKALNAGIVTGDLTINVTSDLTIEDGAVALNQLVEEGAGGYRITIKPLGGAVTISGSSPGALIMLNGADRITFDGTNTTLGPDAIDDNLTIVNNSSAVTSAVIWVQSVPAANGATDNVFKNLAISGNSPATTLVGIGFGGPTIGLGSLGTGNNTNRVEGCDIQKVQYGIYSQGASAANKNTGNIFTQNTLSAASPNNIGKGGIITGFENNLQVTQNTISNIAQSGAVDVFGISLGLQTLTSTSIAGNEVNNATVSRNSIGAVRNTGNFSACGICLSPAASGSTQIANNLVSGVSANGTAGHISVGILAGGGAGSSTAIAYNSVSMTGTQTGGNDKSFALAIGGGDPSVNVRNNILYNTQNNGSGNNYSIAAGSATFANLVSNYNDLFVAADATHFVGATGSLNAPTNQSTLANWTTATGRDTPNSISVDPQFITVTDLHPQSTSAVIAAGTPIAGITTDFSGAARSATTPTIGAYEAGVDTIGPTITYTPLAKTISTSNRTLSITVTDASGVPTTGTGRPKVYYRKGNSGIFASMQCTFVSGSNYDCLIDYTLVTGGSVAAGDTIQYYVAAQDTVGNVSVLPSAGASGFTANPPTASTPPTTPNSYLIAASVSGALNVGTAQTFTSLTRNDAGGIFRYINTNIVTGDITINLTSDLLAEDGAVALNEFAAPHTLTIIPSGAARSISGASTGATALIKLNGADRVMINGSVDGAGTDVSLSVTNTNANGPVIWIASASATDGANNNTIQYCSIVGSGAAGTFAGLLAGSGTTLGSPADAANDNNTFRGNTVTRAQNGVYVNGKAAGGDTNWLITGNTIGSSTPADKLGLRGVLLANAAQAKITQNVIAGVSSSAASTANVTGISVSGLISGGEISRNRISDIKQLNPTGFGSSGIELASTSTNANFLVSNNFVSDVASQGKAGVTASDNGYGLMISSGGGYRIYNNSVSLSTDQTSASGVTAAMNIAAAVTGTGSLDVRNNIFSTSQTIGTRYAVYVASPAGNAIFSTIDRNDYFAQNVGFLGSTWATIVDWRTATGQDAASPAVDPKFVSASDLHLLETSTLIDAGVTLAAVVDDIDGEARPIFLGYDIGADEYADHTPPDTTILTMPSNPSNSPTAQFTFTGTDAGRSGVAGFECSLDGATFATCTSPRNYSSLADGSHTFQVRAKDNAGNIDPTPASFTWVVDTVAPDTQILTSPSNPTNSTSATFTFTGTLIADVAGFECKLDAAAFAPCTSPQTYAGLSDGSHTIQVRAFDAATNRDQTPATFTWVIDTLPPDTQILTKPTDPSSSTSATFTFSGVDTIVTNPVTFECKLDTDPFAVCTSPKNYTGLAEGSHTFQVRTKDAAGNLDPTPATFTWFIDSIAPDTQILTTPTDPSNSTDATFTFTGTDLPPGGTLTFECKLDAAAFAACTSPSSYSNLTEGSHTFQVRAKDPVGNVDQSPATFTWTVIYAVSVTANQGVFGPTKYVTLKNAFDAVNGGVHRGDVTIDLVGNTIETVSVTLNANGTGAAFFNSVLIRPSGGVARSITGNIAGPLIDLDGADSVQINGQGGKLLTISNTSTDPNASTVRLINDACSNSFFNTIIRGSTGASSNTGLGVVYFGQGISTGNDSNNFSGNIITAAGSALPINGIYSVGSGPGVENDGNSVSSNEISNYFNANGSSNGINLGANNSGWVISANKMFQSATRTYLTAAVHTGINITSGVAHSLFGNVIGSSAPNQTGNYTMDGAVATRFIGINLAVGTAADSFVQGNTIASISLTTTSGAFSGAGVLCGLNIVSGNVRVGDSGPNTFGSNGSLNSLVAISSATQAAVVGINSGTTGTVVIRGNFFGGLTSANPALPAVGGVVYGVNISAAPSSITIFQNTIGNFIADNMRAGVAGVTTGDSIAVAINAAPATPPVADYSKNIIRNFSSYGTGASGYVRGIHTGTTPNSSSTATVDANIISNLATNSTLEGLLSANAAAVGIQFLTGTNVTITGNIISNISALNNASLNTVAAGITHASATNTVIARNQIFGLSNASTSTAVATPGTVAGIVIRSATTAIDVQNNMISLGTGQATNTAIIGIWAHHGATPNPVDRIYYNTVNIAGTAASGALPSMGLLRGDFQASRTVTVDIRNNIFNNTRSGGTGKHYAIANNYGIVGGSSATGWPASASNYNVLNANPTTVGYWSADTTFAGWKAASAGDGASLSGIAVNFVNSVSNLHINAGQTPSALESGGTPIAGLTTDIDGQTRPGPAGSVNGAAYAPDLGADEFDGVYLDASGPVITYTPLTDVTTTGNRTLTVNVADTTGVASGTNLPRIYYKKSSAPSYVSKQCVFASGTSQNGSYNCPVDYTAIPGGSVSTGDIVQYFVVAQDTSANVSANPSVGFAGTGVNNVTAPPTNANSYAITLQFNGTMTVGTGGTYASLTNPGGVFAALNSGVLTGNVTINIVSDLLAETGTIPLDQTTEEGVGGYSITIKPSGGPRIISGSSDLWILRITDADRVTIDGSLNGGAANAIGGDASLRNLTIQNTSINANGGAVVAVSAVANTVDSFTIKNVVISGQDATQTLVGLHIGGLNAGDDGGPNNNARIENCAFQRSQIGIYNGGGTVTPNSNNVITMNDLSATSTLRLLRGGMLLYNQDNMQVTMNTVGGIVNDVGADAYGIGAGIQGFTTTTVANGKITNSLISRNRIRGVVNLNTTGFSGVGIGISGGSGGANTISNNMISGVSAISTTIDITAGIFVTGVPGSSTKLYFNSVAMTGDRGGDPLQTGSYGIAITGSNPTVDLRNNIFYTTQTSGGGVNAKSFAIGMVTTTFTNLTSNYNDFYSNGANAAGFRTGGLGASGTDIATLAGWRSATGKDPNSLAADPVYTDTFADLHLTLSSPMLKAGTAISGQTIDFDNDTRSVPPDIGADQVDQTPPDTQILTFPPNPSPSGTATFTFSGSDSLVNTVASYECKLDAAAFATCTSPQTYNNLAEGSHTFQVRARDAAGNPDASPATYTWKVDTTPPDTQILSNPTNPSSASVAFTFNGTDPNGGTVAGFDCRLDAAAFASCTSPQTYNNLAEGSHTFQVRARDAVGFPDPSPASYTWTVDTTPPDTQILTNPTNPTNSTVAAFTFSGTDPNGGTVASFECKLDAAAFATCTSPQNYNNLAEGSHTFQVRARDAAGNPDASPATFTWTVDTAPPDTQILTNPSNPTNSTVAAFTFSGTDPNGGTVASFECKLDAGAFATCTSPQNYNNLAEGSHTFQVRARDAAGNPDASPATFTWTVDTTPPDTQILTNPLTVTASTSATFTFSGSDANGGTVASFECKLDTGGFTVCTSGQVYNGLADGQHTFQVRAKDSANNVDASPATYTWTVDTTPPDTQILTNPANPTASTSATFTFSGSDPAGGTIAGFECKLDTANFAACTSPQVYNGLAGGSHTFQVRSKDAANNLDASPVTFTWSIDTSGPDTQILSHPTNPSNSASATFTFSGTDSLVNTVAGFECKLDAAPTFAACTSPQTYNALAEGSHTFQVRTKDDVGNVDASPATFTWTVDTIAPDTQILTNPTNPSPSSDAAFTFTGTDAPANAIARFECKLDAAPFATCNSTANYSLLADGSHNFQVRAIDAAENVDATPASFTWVIATSVSGTVTVGAGGDYASLTNAGGLFERLNSVGASGNVTANITSNLAAETGAVALNQIAGGFSLTIKPSSGPRTISGNGSALGMIRLVGADNVTIDGSTSGGTDRSLTLMYGNASGTVVWIGSASGSNGALGNTVKNCIISGAPATTVTAGVFAGSGSALGGAATSPNSNNTISNNAIYRVQNSIYVSGAAALDQNWNIVGNTLGSTVEADMNQSRGLFIGNAQGFTINGNLISGVLSTPLTSAATSGIQLTNSISSGFVVNNTINNIKNVSPSGTGAFGIEVSATSPAANVTIANNFISDVSAAGSPTLASNGFGIAFDGSGAGGYKLYHNSVNLNSTQTSGVTAAILVSNSVTAAGALEIRSNIFANSPSAGATGYAIYSGAAPNVYSALGNNDYFAPIVGFMSGAARATLADWQGVSGMDSTSQAVDPRFVSSSDLHLKRTSPMINAALTIAAVTSDIDGQSRPIGPANDIGADEAASRTALFDFDGDGKSDESVFRPTDTVWYLNRSQAGFTAYQFGAAGDLISPADFTGDGKTDVAVFRPSTGNWFILRSEDNTFYGAQFGLSGDIPSPGDYDGDGKADFAVFRPSTAMWYLQQSTAGFSAFPFGASGDVPTLGDFDGDGKTDVALFRASNGAWYRLNSSNGSFFAAQFGITSDKIVPADYTGDGKTDLAIWRPASGMWYIMRSEDGSFYGVQFGANGDLPSPGDYDGDGKADPTVFRPGSGTWFEQRSTSGFAAVQFGANGDKPGPNAYVY